MKYYEPDSTSKFLRYLRFFVNFDIEASNSISKVVYSISKQPSISKASISKTEETFDIGGGKVPDVWSGEIVAAMQGEYVL